MAVSLWQRQGPGSIFRFGEKSPPLPAEAGILDPASRQDETGCGRLRKYDLTIASGAGASSLSWLAGPLDGGRR